MPDMTTVNYLWPFIQGEFADKEAALTDYSKWLADVEGPAQGLLSRFDDLGFNFFDFEIFKKDEPADERNDQQDDQNGKNNSEDF